MQGPGGRAGVGRRAAAPRRHSPRALPSPARPRRGRSPRPRPTACGIASSTSSAVTAAPNLEAASTRAAVSSAPSRAELGRELGVLRVQCLDAVVRTVQAEQPVAGAGPPRPAPRRRRRRRADVRGPSAPRGAPAPPRAAPGRRRPPARTTRARRPGRRRAPRPRAACSARASSRGSCPATDSRARRAAVSSCSASTSCAASSPVRACLGVDGRTAQVVGVGQPLDLRAERLGLPRLPAPRPRSRRVRAAAARPRGARSPASARSWSSVARTSRHLAHSPANRSRRSSTAVRRTGRAPRAAAPAAAVAAGRSGRGPPAGARRARRGRRPGRERPPTCARDAPVGTDRAREQQRALVELAAGVERPHRPRGGRPASSRRPSTTASAATGADPAGVGAAAEQQGQALHDHRLAGAGLAGDHRQARGELEHGLIDHTEALDAHLLEHAFDPSRDDRRPGETVGRWSGGDQARRAPAAPPVDVEVELVDQRVGERPWVRASGPAAPAYALGGPRPARRAAGRSCAGRRRPARPAPRSASTSRATTDVVATTIGRANSACALMGTSSSASTAGQTIGPTGAEGVRRRARRRRGDDPVAAPPRQRAAVDLDDDLEHALPGGLLDRRLVEGPSLPQQPAVQGGRDVDGQPLLDVVVTVQHVLRRCRRGRSTRPPRGSRPGRG